MALPVRYSKNEIIEAYKGLQIARPENINDSLLVSDSQITPVNLSRHTPISGNLNSNFKKRVVNNNKKSKSTPVKGGGGAHGVHATQSAHAPHAAPAPDWDNHSGWAQRFKKGDDLFNRKVASKPVSRPVSRPASRPATPTTPTTPPKGLLNRPSKKAVDGVQQPQQVVQQPQQHAPPQPPPQPLSDWVYRDPSGSLQGPFNPDTMQQWFLSAYFPPSLLVSRVDSETFIPLDELLARVADRSQPFHSAIVVDVNKLYHPQPQPQPQLQRLAATDSAGPSPVSTPFARPLWASGSGSGSPMVDVEQHHQQQQQTKEEILLALRHRDLLEQQQQQQHQQQQQQFIQHQLLHQQAAAQQQQQQQELHVWQLQQQAQQEAQKQAQEQAQEQLAHTHLRDDADLSVAVEAPESTVDSGSIAEESVMSPIKTPPSVAVAPVAPVAPVAQVQGVEPVQAVHPQHSHSQPLSGRGGVNVVTQAELERVQRGVNGGGVGSGRDIAPHHSSDSPKMSVSLGDVLEKQGGHTNTHTTYPPKKAAPAPWAAQAQVQTENVREKTTPSLKEIQEAEARQSAAKKQAQAQRSAAQKQQQQPSARVDDVLPGTLNWGLASSGSGASQQAHNGSNTNSKDITSTSTSTPPAWGGSSLGQKKNLRQIQEEEEAKEREVQRKNVATAQAHAAARGYAASAQRTAQLNGMTGANANANANPNPNANIGNGAWTVVQGSGVKPGAVASQGSGLGSQTQSGAPAKTAKASNTPAKTAATPAAPTPSVSVPASIAQGSNVREPGAPSEEFVKWCKGSMTGLNGTTADEILPILLSFDIEKPDLELIQDMVYASSSTMDGRRFASEFARKRKEDAKGVTGLTGTATTTKAPQETFKVVQKKKKRV
ncbi:hypothetical protein E3P86_03741 [Wallemia ichthyophaga]|uniref:GYF domain-containing protein n=1 Tax=Wallemia ichthyophaga TaxID=245174 RepID=A0A4T0IPD8_WALIC|nr:hypothetical protein E3P86_03741 [Wallemia ichthyophaga]